MQVCLFVCLFWSKQLLPCMNKKTKVKEREYRIYENASEITEVCLADHSYTFFRYPEQTRSLRSHQEFSPKLGNKRSFLPDNTLFESPPPRIAIPLSPHFSFPGVLLIGSFSRLCDHYDHSHVVRGAPANTGTIGAADSRSAFGENSLKGCPHNAGGQGGGRCSVPPVVRAEDFLCLVRVIALFDLGV